MCFLVLVRRIKTSKEEFKELLFNLLMNGVITFKDLNDVYKNFEDKKASVEWKKEELKNIAFDLLKNKEITFKDLNEMYKEFWNKLEI